MKRITLGLLSILLVAAGACSKDKAGEPDDADEATQPGGPQATVAIPTTRDLPTVGGDITLSGELRVLSEGDGGAAAAVGYEVAAVPTTEEAALAALLGIEGYEVANPDSRARLRSVAVDVDRVMFNSIAAAAARTDEGGRFQLGTTTNSTFLCVFEKLYAPPGRDAGSTGLIGCVDVIGSDRIVLAYNGTGISLVG